MTGTPKTGYNGGDGTISRRIDKKNRRGITWGISHLTNVTNWSQNHAMLLRFDCDLSLDVDDPVMKRTGVEHKPDVYFRQGLTGGQRKRIQEENKKLRNH